MKKNVKIFIKNSIILTICNIFFRIISIFFNGYISQKIGSEILGTYNLVLAVYSFGIILGNFGIDFSTIKLISEYISEKNYELIYKISHKCIKISLFIGIITSIFFAIFSKLIVSVFLHDKISINVIFIMCLSIPFISASSSIYSYFIAVRRVYKSSFAQFIEQIIKFAISFWLLQYYSNFGIKYICFSLILGDLISEVFAFFINYILFIFDLKKYKTNYHTILHSSFYNKRIFYLAFPIAMTSILRTGLSSIKQFIIPLSLSKSKFNYSQSLSIYGKINGMAFPIILFPSIILKSFSSLLIPEFSSLTFQNKYQKTKKAIKVCLFTSTAFAFFISSVLYIFADKLSFLIYHNSEITNYIKILSPISIFILLDGVIDNILRGINKQNNVMYINILDLILTTLLIYFVVPIFGINGYIFCIYFSEIFNLILSFYQLKRR